jgi:hypothetical protein
LNFADLSRTLALPQTTLKRYFALLEATFRGATVAALVEATWGSGSFKPEGLFE